MHFLTSHPPPLTLTHALPGWGATGPQLLVPHGGTDREPHAPQAEGKPSAHRCPRPAAQLRPGSQGAGAGVCLWPAVPSGGSDSCLPGSCSESRGLIPAVLSTKPLQPCRAGTGPLSRCRKRGLAWQWLRALWKPGPGPSPRAHSAAPLLPREGPPGTFLGVGPGNSIPCAHSSLQAILSRRQRATG